MNNEIKIGEVIYKLKEDKNVFTESMLYVTKDELNNIKSVSLECWFDENINSGEEFSVSPYINIADIEIKKELKDLTGFMFEVKTPDESDEREDSFCYYEQEPFEKYTLKINSYNESNANVTLTGIGITDGYSKPYKTKTFEMNCTLPVKINLEKNELLNLTSSEVSGINKLLKPKYDFTFYFDEVKIFKKGKFVRTIKYENVKEVSKKQDILTIKADPTLNINNITDEVFNTIKEIIKK